MKDNYDVIIIGAGISGLGTAAFLGQAGKKVLVLESNNQIGGRVATFDYKGYMLGLGTHAGFSGGKFDQLFEKIGKEMPPREYIEFPKIYNFETKELKDSLSIINPENPELLILMQALMGITEDNLPDYDEVSAQEWLSNLVKDEWLFNLFSWLGLTQSCVPDLEKLAASSLIQSIQKMIQIPQIYLPVKGFGEFCRIISEAATENNAEIETGARVSQIIVEDKKVKGVLVESPDEDPDGVLGDARRIEAPIVVTAFPIWNLFKLIQEEMFPTDFVQKARGHDKKSANIGIVAGLKEPLYTDKYFYLSKLPRADMVSLTVMTSNAVPSMAPEGEHLLELVCITDYDICKNRELMHKTIEYMKEDLEEMLPGWEEKVIWLRPYFHWVDPARIVGIHGKNRIGPKAPGIEGLYFTGDSVNSRVAPGMECACDSAEICVKEILGE